MFDQYDYQQYDYQQYDYQQYGTTTAEPKYTKQKPMPSREELLARNSFPSVNQNKHLDRMLGKCK